MPDTSDQSTISMTPAELAAFGREIVDEAIARLEARREPVEADIIAIGNLRIDFLAREAYVDDARIFPKPREFALLASLMRNAGRVLSRDQLLSLAWPDPVDVDDDRTVDVHIQRVRRVLGDAGRLIETVRGYGYKIARPAASRREG